MNPSEEFLVLSGDALEYCPMTPWMRLYCLVFGWEDAPIKVRAFVPDCAEQLAQGALSTLTPLEQQLVRKRLGLEAQPPADAPSASPEERERVTSKALRKLRHPSRAQRLRGEPESVRYGTNYVVGEAAYYERLEGLLRTELQGVLTGSAKQFVYAEKILERSHLSIRTLQTAPEVSRNPNCNLTLEELDLSVRSYNCLKRAGIKTLAQLIEKLREDPTFVQDSAGIKSAQEVEGKIRMLSGENALADQFTTVEITRGGEKTIYKFVTSNMEKIADSIYKSELLQNRRQKTVLGGDTFSPGLADLLMLLGYFYTDDVLADAASLHETLCTLGLDAFAQELSVLACCERSIAAKGAAAMENALLFPPKTAALAREKKCETPNDLLAALCAADHTEALDEVFSTTFISPQDAPAIDDNIFFEESELTIRLPHS